MPPASTMERHAADLFAGHRTKLRVKKTLIAEGATEEQANLAVEAGWQIHQEELKGRRLRNRIVGAVILVVGLALNIYTLFFIDGRIVAIGAFIVLTLAGLFVVIDPDALSEVPSYFRKDEEP